MIQKEAWPFYRTSSGVRLRWVSKNLKDLRDGVRLYWKLEGPKEPKPFKT